MYFRKVCSRFTENAVTGKVSVNNIISYYFLIFRFLEAVPKREESETVKRVFEVLHNEMKPKEPQMDQPLGKFQTDMK